MYSRILLVGVHTCAVTLEHTWEPLKILKNCTVYHIYSREMKSCIYT